MYLRKQIFKNVYGKSSKTFSIRITEKKWSLEKQHQTLKKQQRITCPPSFCWKGVWRGPASEWTWWDTRTPRGRHLTAPPPQPAHSRTGTPTTISDSSFEDTNTSQEWEKIQTLSYIIENVIHSIIRQKQGLIKLRIHF